MLYVSRKTLVHTIRRAKPLTLEEGTNILKRDQFRCQYCGLDGMANFENSLIMTVDFVIPRARKGKKDPRNLVTGKLFATPQYSLGGQAANAGGHAGRADLSAHCADPIAGRSYPSAQAYNGPAASHFP